MKKFSLLICIVSLCFFLNSCDSADEVLNTIDCNSRVDDYNTNVNKLSDYLETVSNDGSAFTCEEFEPIWNDFTNSFDNLCDESKTTELTTSFNEVSTAAELLSILGGCDIDFD